VKLDRTRSFGKVTPYWQPPEFDRPAAFEQDGRFFDVHDREIVPGRPLVPNGADTPLGVRVSRRRSGALTKEHESLLTLLAGMAQGAYRWNSAPAHRVAEDILSDASALGLNIDKNAVIELLGQAAQLIAGADLKSTRCLEDRDILLMLVGAMANRGYGWCPAQARSETATEIHNDVLKLGLSIDVDTVRKYLKLAAEKLPGPAKL